jgi:hypothetical protein
MHDLVTGLKLPTRDSTSPKDVVLGSLAERKCVSHGPWDVRGSTSSSLNALPQSRSQPFLEIVLEIQIFRL